MSGLSLSSCSVDVVDVMPNSSAWIVAMTAQLTASDHSSSPSRTTGPSGSFEKMSSRITSASGPPSASGKADRTPASCELVRRPAVALAAEERLPDLVGLVERQRRVAEASPASNAVARLSSVVVPDSTQIVVPSMSSIDVKPGVGADHHPLAVVERRGQRSAAPSPPSRLAVQVVLRISTSISPDCRAVKRCSAVSGDELDRLGVAEHGGGDDPAELDVEAGEVAGVVDEAEAGHGVVHAAVQRAAVLHLGEEALAGPAPGLLGGLVLRGVRFVVIAACRADQRDRQRHDDSSGSDGSGHGVAPMPEAHDPSTCRPNRDCRSHTCTCCPPETP